MYYRGGCAPFLFPGSSKLSTLEMTLYDNATHCNTPYWRRSGTGCTGQLSLYAQAATHCSTRKTLQHTATHCNALNTVALQRTATPCNALQHTATHCNTLQRTAAHFNIL